MNLPRSSPLQPSGAVACWVPQCTRLPSVDLPATSQPVQKSPQAGEPPEIQGSGGKGLTLLWNSCLSESYHLKNVSYTKGCTENFFSLFCFHLSPSWAFTCRLLRARDKGVCGEGTLYTDKHKCNTHTHGTHTYTDTHLCKHVETHRYTCGHRHTDT